MTNVGEPPVTRPQFVHPAVEDASARPNAAHIRCSDITGLLVGNLHLAGEARGNPFVLGTDVLFAAAAQQTRRQKNGYCRGDAHEANPTIPLPSEDMAECYCGCGRKLGALASHRKSANKMGGMVTGALLAVDNEVRPKLDALSPKLRTTMTERVDQASKEGRWFEQDCRRVVHEEMKFGDAPWPAIREWIRDAQGLISWFRLPPDAQRAIIQQG